MTDLLNRMEGAAFRLCGGHFEPKTEQEGQDGALLLEAMNRIKELELMRDGVRSDAYAMSFQSMGQYRSALLKLAAGHGKAEGSTPRVLHDPILRIKVSNTLRSFHRASTWPEADVAAEVAAIDAILHAVVAAHNYAAITISEQTF